MTETAQFSKNGAIKMTPEMKHYCRMSPVLTRFTTEYTAPKDNPLESFRYTPLAIGGKAKGVFVYANSQEVNTWVMDLEDVTEYPFCYYESDQQSEELSPEKTFRFIGEEPQRVEILKSMFQIVLDFYDKEQPTRQILLCDEPDNHIWWIGAISALFPLEMSLRLSYITYTFLGEADKKTPIYYDDTAICGVYAGNHATNYDFRRECARNDATVFDFERGFFADVPLRDADFCELLEKTFSGDYRELQEYQEFISAHTNCRRPDNHYLQGYAYFQLMHSPDVDDLHRLSEARDFAEKYMNGDSLTELVEVLLTNSVDKDKAGIDFSVLLEFVEYCMKEGAVVREDVIARYLNFLKRIFPDVACDVYQEYRRQIQGLCNRQNVRFEKSFINAISDEEFSALTQQKHKVWLQSELVSLLCRSISHKEKAFLQDTPQMVALKNALLNLLEEPETFEEMLPALVEECHNVSEKNAFLNLVYELSEDSGAVEFLVQLYHEQQEQNDTYEFLLSIAGKSIAEPFFDAIEQEFMQGLDFQKVEIAFGEMLDCHSFYLQYRGRMVEVLSSLSMTDDPNTARESTYRLFRFAQKYRLLNERISADLFEMYCDLLKEGGYWYHIDSTISKQLQRFMVAVPDIPEMQAICNMILLYHIEEERTNFKTAPVFQRPSVFGKMKFSVMNEEEQQLCMNAIASALCERTIAGNTAQIPCRYFLETSVNHPCHDMIFRKWFDLLLQQCPKNQISRLTAELLTVMYAYCEVHLQEQGEQLFHAGVKLRDIINQLQNPDLLLILHQNGVRVPETAMDVISQAVTVGYQTAEQNSTFGQIRNKLAGLGGKFRR